MTHALGKGPRTWEATFATPDLQFAYDRGVFEGVCVYVGLMGMAEAIKRNFMCWDCDCFIGLNGRCFCGFFDDHECRPALRIGGAGSEGGGR